MLNSWVKSHRKELCIGLWQRGNLSPHSVWKHCAKPSVKTRLSECGTSGRVSTSPCTGGMQSQKPHQSLLWKQLLMPQAFPPGIGVALTLAWTNGEATGYLMKGQACLLQSLEAAGLDSDSHPRNPKVKPAWNWHALPRWAKDLLQGTPIWILKNTSQGTFPQEGTNTGKIPMPGPHHHHMSCVKLGPCHPVPLSPYTWQGLAKNNVWSAQEETGMSSALEPESDSRERKC